MNAPRLLAIIDNYDSFTYNLVQAFGKLGAEMRVFRNDRITTAELETLNPDRIVISPGPCTPAESGVSVEVIKRFAGKIPILGVCLGHQAIASAFGGKVVRAERLMHGKTSQVRHDGSGIFKGIGNPFEAMRYHSLIVEENTLPSALVPCAWTADQGELMGMRHREYPLFGVQFHPESFMTPEGEKLLDNFLKI
jgi:anthranilate synthase/aminodeoxychorismate synthase-like glutamine amidotransferase